MGICFSSSRKANSSLGAKTSSLATSQTIFSSAPSASTDSTTGGTVPAKRTEEEILSTPNLKPFAFTDLKTATRNFRPDSLVGEGGFGYVYKGWIDEQTFAPARPDSGLMVAVKKLKPEGSQGHKEWLAEVNYLGQLRHPQLVRLIGYCLEGDNRLLVYEFMPRGSLENHLFGNREPLPWATRIVVATGAARGLSFLHESKIIYRDVKSANILLDTDFNAKLSDFGLAKDGPTGDKTHISTLIMGTHGYAAPEYIATGRLSTRADVYSFGVVLLELLTGRRAFSKAKPGGAPQNLVEWVKPHLGDKRKLHEIMDLRLEGKYLRKEAQELAALAFQCIGSNPKLRPPMSDVVATLEKLRDSRKGSTRLATVDSDGKSGVS